MTAPDPNSVPKFPNDAAFLALFAEEARRNVPAHPELSAIARAAVAVVGEHGMNHTITAMLELTTSLIVTLAKNLPGEREWILSEGLRGFAFGYGKIEAFQARRPIPDAVAVVMSDGGRA